MAGQAGHIVRLDKVGRQRQRSVVVLQSVFEAVHLQQQNRAIIDCPAKTWFTHQCLIETHSRFRRAAQSFEGIAVASQDFGIVKLNFESSPDQIESLSIAALLYPQASQQIVRPEGCRIAFENFQIKALSFRQMAR